MNKFLTAASIAAVASANIHDRSYYEAKFYDWVQEHKVHIKSGADFIHMLQNFANNDDLIATTNARNLSYKLGHNAYSHMSNEEFNAYFRLGQGGYVHQPGDSILEPPVDASALPDSVDWTTQGAVTGVKDQGNCGSCWSFSATGALEGAYEIKYGTLESFSEQNLVSCSNSILGNHGCNGGLMDTAFKWVKSNGGLCTEAGYPYTSGTTGVNGDCLQSSCTKNTQVTPTGYVDVTKNSDTALMTAIAQQPVSVAIQANQPAFQLYKSGVLTGTCGTNLDHGVLAVGYGTWTDGTAYYKVKNSWGTSWGMGGYVLIERYSAQVGGQCGILSGPPSYPTL